MLLLDQNLSPRICGLISAQFPGCVHMRDVGLATAPDADVWKYAERHQLAIVSKDSDFHQRSLVFGQPPKVIWIRLGNSSTTAIANLLIRCRTEVVRFLDDPDTTFLSLM